MTCVMSVDYKWLTASVLCPERPHATVLTTCVKKPDYDFLALQISTGPVTDTQSQPLDD